MGIVTTLKAYKALEKQFGSEVASEVLQVIDDKFEEKMIIERIVNKSELATKGDIHRLENLINDKLSIQNKWFIMFSIAIIGLIIALLVKS